MFVFQAGSTLTTASSSSVNLINGAQACNVFWQVGSSATLGTGSTFRGTILALTSITVTIGDDHQRPGPGPQRCGHLGQRHHHEADMRHLGRHHGDGAGGGGTAKANAETRESERHDRCGTTVTGTGTPTGTTGSGTLPFTGINPRVPILGGTLVGLRPRVAGTLERTPPTHERLNDAVTGNPVRSMSGPCVIADRGAVPAPRSAFVAITVTDRRRSQTSLSGPRPPRPGPRCRCRTRGCG